MKVKQGSGHYSRDLLVSLFLVCALGFWHLLRNRDQSVYHSHDLDLTKTIGGPTFNPDPKHLFKAQNGAVACDVPICSKMGTEILMKNGTAADAAVTVALCIGVVNSHSSGIGGGGFIVSKPFGQEAVSIDAREMAPEDSYKDMFNFRENLARVGGLASGIPGELKGLDELFKLHSSGNLKWEELIEPVIKLAREGWEVSDILGMAFASEEEYIIKNDKADWAWALKDDKHVKTEGDFINRPLLLRTLEIIAKNGSSDVFYDPNGFIARSLALKAKSKGGLLTTLDFAKYQTRIEPALNLSFFDDSYQLFTSGGASSGISLIAGLNVMDQFQDRNGAESEAGDLEPIETQRLVETFKWMATVRSNLGDLNIYSDNETEIADHWARYNKFKSLEWANLTNSKINDAHTLPSWKDYNPAYQPNEPHGTSHFSIVDRFNNAVLMTTTVNLLFGSMVHDPVTGIILNDEMDDFSIPTAPNAFGLEPSVYNWIEAFKRPLSSTAPTIVIDQETGKPDFVIGCAGGSRITTLILQAIIRKYHYKMELLDIIAKPRLHHQLLPEILYIENPALDELNKELEAKGHEIEMISHVTAMNGIAYNSREDLWEAVSDFWRKKGELHGY